MTNFGEEVNFIWSVADLPRGPYKPAQDGKVILPPPNLNLKWLNIMAPFASQ